MPKRVDSKTSPDRWDRWSPATRRAPDQGGNFEQAENAFTLLLDQARSDLEKADIYNLRIIKYENMAKYAESIQCGKEGLHLFGFDLPETEAE